MATLEKNRITELKGERAERIAEARSILEKAEGENRGLTSEESQEFDRLEAAADELEARARRLESVLETGPGRQVRDDLSPEEQGEWRAMTPEEQEEERRARNLAAPPLDEIRSRIFTGEMKAPASFKEYNELRMAALPQNAPEYRWSFFRYMTVRDVRELSGDEVRTLSKATAAAGANLVPTNFERQLLDTLRDFGVMRQIARVFSTSDGAALNIPTVTSHGTASWTAENAAFTPSDDAFGQSALAAWKAATIILVSEELLQDAAFDLEAYIRAEFGARIGILENTAYVVGDGSSKPTGVVTQATLGKTGATGQTTSATADDLIDLVYSVSPPYRRRGSFLLNDASVKAIRKLKDTTNQYLWAPGLTATEPDNILGRPIYSDPDMPVMAANAKSILFGDFSQYWIRDVNGIAFQRLNELYAANGQVGFRAYHRTDGKLMNTAAVKYYANSAT